MRSITTMLTLPALQVLMLASIPAGASAAVMEFTHTGSGSGTLDGAPFTTSNFALMAYGETTNRQSYLDGWFIDHTTASIAISGLGEFNILTGTCTFVNNGGELVGLARAGLGADLFNGPLNAAFGTWDMLTPIGPIGGQGSLLQWDRTPQIDTTGGVLIFNDGVCGAAFEAVPEPATVALLALGGLAVTRRKRGYGV